MILDDGQVKVADFGIARLLSSDLTQAGFIIGTPGYMSPEGRLGCVVDNRSDLYSVGVVFYEIITGKRLTPNTPPDGAQLKEGLLEAIGVAEVAEKICELLATVLQEHQDRRFSDAAEFSRALGTILTPDRKHIPDTELIAATVLRADRIPTEAAPKKLVSTHLLENNLAELTPSAIEQVEEALARYIGPLASVLVKKHAKHCSDLASLAEALATHIPDAQEQTQFLTSLSTSGWTSFTYGSKAIRTNSTKIQNTNPNRATLILSTAQLEQISGLLAKYVGPLASRIIKRTQQSATDPQDFCTRLTEHIPAESEKREFLRTAGQIMPPEQY